MERLRPFRLLALRECISLTARVGAADLEDGLGSGDVPAHPGAMKTVLADEADAAFNHAAADGQATLPALLVVEHGTTVLEVLQFQSHGLRPLLSRLPGCPLQAGLKLCEKRVQFVIVESRAHCLAPVVGGLGF